MMKITHENLGIKLASAIAHLAEYIHEGHYADILAAKSVLNDAEVYKALEKMKSSALLPSSRSGKSITQMLEAREVER